MTDNDETPAETEGEAEAPSEDKGVDLDPYDLSFTPTAAGGTDSAFGKEVMEGGPYNVIYADPPWPDKSKDPESSANYMAPPYPTMSAADIISLPVRQIAAPSSILVMWTTWAHLELGMRTVRSWGFEYSTGCPWLKIGPDGKPLFGFGMWFQQCTDPLLIGRKGAVQKMFSAAGYTRTARKGIFIARRQEHSRKPDEVMEWIEATMPGPRVELFARRRREGWTSWGNELPPVEVK